MIDLKHYERILQSGLMFDHYLVLVMIKNGEDLPENKRVQGFVNLLNKKGYILDDVLTDEGTLLTEHEVKVVTTGTMDKNIKEMVEVQTDFAKWVIALHKKCQNKLLELTGGKQVRDKIDKKPYPFLPNSTDLAKVLHKVIILYKLKDMDKIEKAMMNHIEKCHRARNWFPLMKYYIMKNGQSELVTDMDSLEEESNSVDGKSNQKFV